MSYSIEEMRKIEKECADCGKKCRWSDMYYVPETGQWICKTCNETNNE